ncbi:hypothetical protein CERZMDRAFT_89740 [Cercospora zeae-maydis SCOH1-5]|uniref:AA1-like domain-containing protein n=1 Tax=Cercospora zeae-maydis SCOH1-5 TaxID=717836 RepID=A0A6A6FTY4_9PEZI|nr:hypothetical protein CERZMDRAFT_89740 [Cercospora zeae-maydis SCOH1-5]
MFFPTILAASLASLAAAAPAKRDLPGTFEVTNFVYGCSASCFWSFDLGVSGSAQNHPATGPTVKCSGSLDNDTDYVQCGTVSETQTLSAYIEKANNVLHLRYDVTNYNTGATYKYYGDETVYSSTGPDAAKQEESFCVKENRATGVN